MFVWNNLSQKKKIIMLFKHIIESILDDLRLNEIKNLDDFISSVHENSQSYIVNVPDQQSHVFYEFVSKIMGYAIEYNYLDKLPVVVAETFTRCPDEICNVINALSSQSGEDITEDITKILFCYIDASGNNLIYSEDLERTLDLIFDYTDYIWCDLEYVTLDWDQVCNDVLPSTSDFELENCFNSHVVVDKDSAERFLELIYSENGWIGHPEDDIEAGIDFPNYGILAEEEAEYYNGNMLSVFDFYDGDPSTYALSQIDPSFLEDEIDE